MLVIEIDGIHAILIVAFPGDNRPRKSVPAILDWPTVEKKFPWGVLLLIGGGYALADACEVSPVEQELQMINKYISANYN